MNLQFNFRNKKSEIHSDIEKKFRLEDKIYEFDIEILRDKVSINIKKLRKYFFVENCVIYSDNSVVFKIADTTYDRAIKFELWIERRLSEKMWKYKTEKYYISDIEKNGEAKLILPTELLYPVQNRSYFDLIIKCKNGDISANYFLYLKDDVIERKLSEISDSNKKLIFHLYKSGGKNLAFWIQEKSNSILINDIQYNNPYILFNILNSVCDGEIRLLLKKRTFCNSDKMHDRIWDKKVEYTKNEHYINIKVSANEFLKDNIHKADELWDVYLIVNNIQYRIYSKEKKQTEYFSNSDGYKICVFSRDDHGIAVYTHESDYQNNRKIKIAVLGTCFSRSVFKSAPYFNCDYKKCYDCVYTQFHSSIISLASEPLKDEFWKDEVEMLSKEQQLYLPTEFQKDFFEKLSEAKPQYFFMDNYVDATRPIIKVRENCYITYSKHLINTNFMRKFAECEFILPGTDEHIRLLEHYAEKFFERLIEIVPEERIILLEGRFSKTKIDEKTKKIENWSYREWIEESNYIWDVVDNIVLNTIPNAKEIDMRNCMWHSDINSPIPGGASPSHYQKYYYREILDKINKIVLADIMNNLV